MSIEALRGAVDAIRAGGRVTEDDVRRLRRDLLPDGVTSRLQADCLLELEAAGLPHGAAWTMFFVETLADFLLFCERPNGAISASSAEWLLGRAYSEGRSPTRGMRALCIELVRVASEADPRIVALGLGHAAWARPRHSAAHTLGWLDRSGVGV